MWEFFHLDGELDPVKAAGALQAEGISFTKLETLPRAKHVFTHIEWHMTGYAVTLDKPAQGFTFVTANQLEEGFALPAAFRTYTAEAKRRLSV